jgi:hypothetical protein
MSTTTQQKSALKKQIKHVFRKDIFLLGTDNEGVKYWLEAPSWDCGWYWGFGYVETYTDNTNPEKAKDISSHRHIDTFFKRANKISLWNTELSKHAYTGSEAAQLNELFTSFYQLQKAAGSLHDNDYNCNSIDELKKIQPIDENHGKWLDLVTNQIPGIMDEIIDILNPNN